jgi:hypothetical protein
MSEENEDSMSPDMVDYSGAHLSSDHERALFEEAFIGNEMSSFLETRTGRNLFLQAQNLLESSKSDLMEIEMNFDRGSPKWKEAMQDAGVAGFFLLWFNPEKVKAERQNRAVKNAGIGARFIQWCQEVVNNGRTAEERFNIEREDADNA